jgi:hypothetical protein
MKAVDPQHNAVGGPAFWIAAVIGWAVIVGGVRAGLDDRELKPGLLAKWAVGGLVLHDGIWLPVLALVGAAITLALRRRVPRFVVWATMTSAVLTLIGWPFVRGYGRRADVPSALQRNYARGLLVYIALAWALAAAAAVAAHRRGRAHVRDGSDSEAETQGR